MLHTWYHFHLCLRIYNTQFFFLSSVHKLQLRHCTRIDRPAKIHYNRMVAIRVKADKRGIFPRHTEVRCSITVAAD